MLIQCGHQPVADRHSRPTEHRPRKIVSQLGHRNARYYREQHLTEHLGQRIDAALRGPRALHALKVRRQPQRADEHAHAQPKLLPDGRQHDPVFEQYPRNHSFLANARLPRDEDGGHYAGADEEPDDGGAVPGVGAVAAELEGEKEHDDGWGEDGEAGEVELVEEEVAEEGEGVGCFGVGLGDVDEEDHGGGDGADGEVDVEAFVHHVSVNVWDGKHG